MTGIGASSACSAIGADLSHAAHSLPVCGATEPVISADVAVGGFSQEAREIAITRARLLRDYFRAEKDCFEPLYWRTDCLSHKGAADRAAINETKAGEILASLEQGARA